MLSVFSILTSKSEILVIISLIVNRLIDKFDLCREITEFRLEIRESKEVKFALEVLRALNSTNYVRFFKLLQ